MRYLHALKLPHSLGRGRIVASSMCSLASPHFAYPILLWYLCVQEERPVPTPQPGGENYLPFVLTSSFHLPSNHVQSLSTHTHMDTHTCTYTHITPHTWTRYIHTHLMQRCSWQCGQQVSVGLTCISSRPGGLETLLSMSHWWQGTSPVGGSLLWGKMSPTSRKVDLCVCYRLQFSHSS